ncbi:aminoglycoside phosphotransferase [Kribbella flavida DSM 17836]|uniref:Aminoglycoside phosphotransferase n=1 Tax=Kribbella flavida (strain DSM 17836 / JCM 10339 / NBRC 14399) TaxID=479435 RepID=D2PS12_KRIFD|nr:aminoglycoside phosphotransferase family protein [Kribbella flavida]ADB29342.1 aminoglycoside phosphotransferase [Kribbella flavida DSM 17836]
MEHDIAALLHKAAPRSEIAEVLPRSGGQLATVFEVRRIAAAPLIIKLYSPEWAWKQAKEIHVYDLLAPHLGTAIPQVVHAEPEGETHAFTVMTMLTGVPLCETTAPDYQVVYKQLGELLTAIHRIPQPAYGYLTDEVLEPLPSNDAYMRRQFAKKLQEFEELGGDRALHARLTEYVEQHSGLFASSSRPVLCHNDFHEGNVLVDPDTWQVQGIVDVENAIAADPLIDLAKTQYYSIKNDQAKLSGLLTGYGELPSDWVERTAVYRLYHALELWDWFRLIGVIDPLESIAADLVSLLGTSRVAGRPDAVR